MVYPVNGQSGTSTVDVQNAKVQATSTASHEPGLQEGKKLITIQRGETLTGIARKYQTTLGQLIELNGIKNPDKVKAGQKIWVTVPVPEVNKAAVGTQTAETGKDIEVKKSSEPATVSKLSQGSNKSNLFYINHVISAIAMVKPKSVLTVAQSAPVEMIEIFVNNDSEQENYTIVLEPTPAEPIQVEETKTAAAAETAVAVATVQKNEVVQNTNATNLSRGENSFSEEDIDLLARVIYAEARGEDFEGQVAVGAVVLNRLADPHFPKTVRAVIYQQGAFTAVSDKQINLKPDDEAYRAAEAAIAGEDPTDGAIYYYNPKTATDRWIKSRKVIKTIGNHTFSI